MTASEPAPLDESFPHRYAAVAKEAVSTPDDLIYFPSRPALVVEVNPTRGEQWTGTFGEYYHRGFVNGLFSTPDDITICVVSGGSGYFVETTDPRDWFPVNCTPIRFVLPFPKHGVLVFGSFTDFIAYRCDPESADVRIEVAWQSARLGYDDLDVMRTTDDRIEGQAWHAPNNRMIGFSLDVSTGEHEGGAFVVDDQQ